MKSETLERLLIDHDAGELSPDVEELLEDKLRQDPAALREAAEISQTLRLARLALAGEPMIAVPFRRRALPVNPWALGMAACVVAAGLLGVFAIRDRYGSPRVANSFPARQIASAPGADESSFWSERRLRSTIASSRGKDDLRILWTSPVTKPEPFSK